MIALLVRGVTFLGTSVLAFFGVSAISESEKLLRALLPVILAGGAVFVLTR